MRTPLSALVLVVTAGLGPAVHAEANRVTFPPNIGALQHYTTVTRGGVTEHMLTTQSAIDAIKGGRPTPNGTHVVLVDYRDGKVFRYFVMEKGEGWGDEYAPRRRTGNWQFQWFNPDQSVNLAENTARCQSCHQSREASDHLFTSGALTAAD